MNYLQKKKLAFMIAVNQKKNFIPSKYQQVKYIEGTGTQYIDVDYIPKTNTIVNVDFKSTKKSGEVFTSLFGTQLGSQHRRIYILFGASLNIQIGIPTPTVKAAFLNSNRIVSLLEDGSNSPYWNSNRATWSVDIKNKKATDGVLTWDLSNVFTETPIDCSTSLYLLTRNTGGVADANRSKGYLYGATIYEGNKLVCDLYPCYRLSDNTIGMYDVVRNRFFTNAGAGTFLKGENI